MRTSVLTLAVLVCAGFAVAADDLETNLQNLKQAEAQKNIDQVKKLAANIFTEAHAAMAAPAPTDAVDKEMWTDNVAQAKEAQMYAEYALSALSYAGPPALTIELLSMIEKENPKSKYLDASYDRYLYALTETGATAQVVPTAEKGLANFPENTDLLLVLMNGASEHNQANNALTYARRLVAALSKRAKPENLSEADWQKKKDTDLGRGYWVIGMISSQRNSYMDADRNLRAALPLIKGNDAELGPALYALGVVNYQLGRQTLNKARVLEAVKFSEQAAAIPGPQQQEAYHNANVMKDEAVKMR